MPIVNNVAVAAVTNKLKAKGFDLEKAPQTKDFVEVLVNAVLDEVKKATVTTTVTGASATGGPVSGAGTGTIA